MVGTSRRPSGDTPRRRWRGASIALPAFLIAAAAFLAMPGCGRGKHQEPRVQVPDSDLTPAELLEKRIAGNPTDRRMAEVLGAQAFANDPHTFACKVCHDRFVQKAPEEWRKTCYSVGCHPRAWPKTVMHRVDPAVFENCLNCHHPHTWRANAGDCLSCHGDLGGPRGTVPATEVSGVGTFPHGPHLALPCARCHDSTHQHAKLLVTSAAQCQSCHHGASGAAACTTCHGGAQTDFTRNLDVSMKLSVWPAAETRTLPFDHGKHRRLACESCHAPGHVETPVARCASCHDAHHRPEARCIACHRPPAAGAHDLAVHTGGCRTCHGASSFAHMIQSRNFCLGCHQEQVDHMEGKNCAGCHKITAAGAGGGG